MTLTLKIVSWCFKLSQPQRILSGLKETLIKRQLKGPTKQKWDQKNRVRKRRVVGRIYGTKYSWKGHKDRTKLKNNKKEWEISVGLCQKHKPQHPHHVKVCLRGPFKIANQSFSMTLRLKMMHHSAKFGNKMFGGLKDMWTNINILTFTVTLTLNTAIFFFFHNNSCLWWCIITPSLVAKESAVQEV